MSGEVVDKNGKIVENGKVKIKIGNIKVKEYETTTNNKGVFEKLIGNFFLFNNYFVLKR